MTCDEVFPAFEMGDTAREQEARQHVRHCPVCAAALDRWHDLKVELAWMPELTAREQLMWRQAPRQPSRHRRMLLKWVLVAVPAGAIVTVILLLVLQVRLAAQRTVSMNNLSLIGWAMLKYEAANKTYPARANFDKEGKALLSWRVHILPFLGHDNLYRQFKLDEPWDSPTNKKLIARMPTVYAASQSQAGRDDKTTYLVPTGQASMFRGDTGIRLEDIKNGPSNTIMVFQTDDSRAVYWTQPEDLPVDSKDLLDGLEIEGLSAYLAAFADGSVQLISKDRSLAAIQALCAPN